MSDTRPCPSCRSQVPSMAAFCTECGEPLPAAVAEDPTTVSGPPLTDATAVAAPWAPPAESAPPTWQAPVAPPTTATPPPLGGSPAWAPPPPPAGAAGEPTPATEAHPSIPGGVAALAGAALTVAGLVATWITLDDGAQTERISGWSLTSDGGTLTSDDPYLLAGLAALAAIGGVLLLVGAARTATRIGLAVVGAAIVTIAALNWVAIADFVTDNLATTVEVRTALGFYLAIAGGVATAVAALAPARS